MISQAAKLAGVPYLLRKQNLMLELAQRIKQGEWVVLHTDMRTEGVPVRWFGQATQLSATPFSLRINSHARSIFIMRSVRG